jgi:plasmid rolling circle replication initiator protein Rep
LTCLSFSEEQAKRKPIGKKIDDSCSDDELTGKSPREEKQSQKWNVTDVYDSSSSDDSDDEDDTHTHTRTRGRSR